MDEYFQLSSSNHWKFSLFECCSSELWEMLKNVFEYIRKYLSISELSL